MEKLTKYFNGKQKVLFLIDSIGAFLTAFFLFVITRYFGEYFGMPKKELICLLVIAGFLCIYSASCFIFSKENIKPFVGVIGVANLIYCASIIRLLIKYFPLLTFVGIIYFLIEIVIICGLSYVELNVAASNKE